MKLVEINKNGNESSASVLRRFSRRVRSSGYLMVARGLRYTSRSKSDLKKRREALHRIQKSKDIARLKKLGKLGN